MNRRRNKLPIGSTLALPDDIGPIEWEDSPLPQEEIDAMWRRLEEADRKFAEIMNAHEAREQRQDRRRRYIAKVVGKKIAEDARKQALLDHIEAERAWWEWDLRENLWYAKQYVKAFAAKLAEQEAWRKKAQARLDAAMIEINRDAMREDNRRVRERLAAIGRPVRS